MVLISIVDLILTEVLYMLPLQGMAGETEHSGRTVTSGRRTCRLRGEWRIRSTNSNFATSKAYSESLTRMEEGGE